MGIMKDSMHEDEANLESAKQIAVEVGLLEYCEDHGYYTDPLNNNFEEAYGLVDERFGDDAEKMKEFIKLAVEDTGEECPGCVSRNRD